MNDLAVKRAMEWLGNHFPTKMNTVNDDWFIGELANELEAYAIDVNDENNMTTKFDIKFAGLKYKRNQMVKLRDEMREQLNDLDYDLECFESGIDEINFGIDQIQVGLDEISQVV